MRVITDAQSPPALARWLSALGYEAEHVVDFGGEGTTDSVIWERACEVDAVLFSKDEDFALRARGSAAGPSVVWIRKGNTRRVDLLIWLERLLPSIEAAVQSGERVIELH